MIICVTDITELKPANRVNRHLDVKIRCEMHPGDVYDLLGELADKYGVEKMRRIMNEILGGD